jgi:cellulose synthase/poly-beta-1,6-N-acetylglucosamine synthase-like glycosyltransferase
MIIQILSNMFQEGYLRRDKYSYLSAFFANANVAFRKEALDQVGLYDTKCISGEDQDMTLRLAKAGWELYFEPKALVRHKNKMTVKGFARKWYDYGYHHPYIFKKHGEKGFHIFINAGLKANNSGIPIYSQLLGFKFPVDINIFLTSFLFIHLLALAAIICAASGASIAAIALTAIASILAIIYFRHDFHLRNPGQSVAFLFYRYTANLALIMGGFLGGIKLRTFYISPTFDYSR